MSGTSQTNGRSYSASISALSTGLETDWDGIVDEETLMSPSAYQASVPPYFERWINSGWFFLHSDEAVPVERYEDLSDEGAWESVALPHTANIEAYDQPKPWQGVCWYRRHIPCNPEWRGKRVSLQFGAAMQIADIWVNGVYRQRHLGGYLPFTIDITEDIEHAESLWVTARLDNRDTPLVPPGKPTDGLDFSYPGGLYRGVKLIVTDSLHISDPLRADIVAGGGIFVRYSRVSDACATVHVKVNVANEAKDPARRCTVRLSLIDGDGLIVAKSGSEPVLITSNGNHDFELTLTVLGPRLWSPDSPDLYTLKATVNRCGEPVDSTEIRIGIRSYSLTNRLLINGKEFHIHGSNRHQEYPYIEYALSPNAARRDAQLIKDGGFNFVRLSHYPQDPAFLDACDELGILVQAAIPGWQIFHDTPSFVSSSFQNIRDLIRRDRNHPSVVFWEPNLNETEGDHQDWCEAAHEIAHQEYPGDQCFTFGDGYPEGWRGWDVKHLVREYGDFGFGGNESTSRHTRGEGEAAMLQQAWNFQWCHNDHWKAWGNPDRTFFGDAVWCMFDYNRGYYHKPCTCGMMDIFRLPKYVYRFFESQREIEGRGPMVFIAADWTHRKALTKVVVFSNCEEVALSINGREIARQKPDSGPDSVYSDWEANIAATIGNLYDSTGGNPFDGGNAKNLDHPPFTFFTVPYEPGVVEAVGMVEGKEAARYCVRTPGQLQRMRISFDTQNVPLCADGADAIFARIEFVDKNDTVCPVNSYPSLALSVTGPARIVGTSPIHVEAGVASVLIQATDVPGEITLHATTNDLAEATATILSQPVLFGVSRTPDAV